MMISAKFEMSGGQRGRGVRQASICAGIRENPGIRLRVRKRPSVCDVLEYGCGWNHLGYVCQTRRALQKATQHEQQETLGENREST